MILCDTIAAVVTQFNASAAVPVLLLQGGRKWTAPGQLVAFAAANPGRVVLKRNRRDVVIGGRLVAHEDPATARAQRSTAGAAYRQVEIGGNVWALTGTPGARGAMEL